MRNFILVHGVNSSDINRIPVLTLAVYLQEAEKMICSVLTYHIQVQIRLPAWGRAAPSGPRSWSVQWHVNASCSLCSHRLSPGSHLPPKPKRGPVIIKAGLVIFQLECAKKLTYAAPQRQEAVTTELLSFCILFNIDLQSAKIHRGDEFEQKSPCGNTNCFIPSSCRFWQQPHPLLVSTRTGPCCTPVLLSGWSRTLCCPAPGRQNRTRHPARQRRRDKEKVAGSDQRGGSTNPWCSGVKRWVQNVRTNQTMSHRNSQNVNGCTIPWNAWIIHGTRGCEQGADH